MRFVLACLIIVPGSAFAGNLRGGGDICAIRPDLCDNDDSSVAALAKQARRAPASARAARRTRAPAAVNATARAKAARRSITCRPASVEVTMSNQDLDVCGAAPSASRAPASTVSTASVDYNSYMMSNAANPALARRVGNYQTAFASTAKAATFVAPSLDGGGQREGEVGGVAAAAPAGRPN